MRSRHPAAITAAAACAALALFPTAARAQYEAPNPTYAAPATYYNPATSGVGPTLKQQLNDIISVHTQSSYDMAHDRLQVLDAGPLIPDPVNPSVMVPSVQLTYSGVYVKAAWDAGATWNREHLWCDSYGIEGAGIYDYGDLFNLRPADPGVNSDRSNEYYFDIPVANRIVAHADAPLCFEDKTISDTSQDQMWEPRAVEKGDIARALFYMDTRYDGADTGTTNLTLTDDVATITSTNSNMGHLSTLLHWHYQDGITNAERKRNDQIYDLYQNNRNPFVDHPEWVWAVFGGGNNNSKLYVGDSAPATGASSTSVNLRVIKDAAGWGSSSVTLNKAGAHPTTFDVATGGAATSTDAGVGQSLDYDPRTRAIQVSLNGATGTVGTVNGTITINNTDVTTGGAGLGSDDGNDTINVTGSVLDHAQPSFVAGSSATAQSLDFSYVPAGFTARTANFSVNNNPAAAGAALTAGLDVDGVSKSGSASMSTNVTASNPAAPLAAGASRSYIASFTPGATEGLVTAAHTIANSDENIPGATARPNLVLTTTGRVTTGSFPVTGNLFLFGGETFNTTSFNIADGATLMKTGPGTMNVGGPQSHGANASLIADAGPVNFLSDSNSTSTEGLRVATTASPLTFQSRQHLRTLELHDVADATVTPDGDHTLVVGAIDVDDTARLNLNDNNLIIRNATAGNADASGVYSGIQGLVQRGYNFGAWDQPGLVTTIQDATDGLTTLAVARAADALLINPTDTLAWRGETVGGNDVLAMYTYAGDLNFDGLVDAADYGVIDNFYQFAGSDGYVNGDFNYDGIIDGGDYGIIDNTFSLQGAPIGAGASASGSVALGSVSAVPEPAGLTLVALSVLPLLSRRRRRERLS